MNTFGRRDQRNQNRERNRQQPVRVPLDMKFLSAGYYQDAEKKKLREDIIKTEAKRLGKTLADEKLTPTQLRKFFNEVRALEAQAEDNFDEQKALILMIKSKVAYSVGKKTSKTPVELKDFMDTCIDKINDEKDFKAFIKFFEAVVGYFFYYNEGGV